MSEIIDDKHLEDIDRKDLGLFLDSERSMYQRLIERNMVTSEQLHDLTWKSVEAVTQNMGAVEIFALLAAIARRSRRYGTYDDPFSYAFDLGFEENLREFMAESTEGPVMMVKALRLYAKDALWHLLDQHLIANRVWDRANEIATTEAA